MSKKSYLGGSNSESTSYTVYIIIGVVTIIIIAIIIYFIFFNSKINYLEAQSVQPNTLYSESYSVDPYTVLFIDRNSYIIKKYFGPGVFKMNSTEIPYEIIVASNLNIVLENQNKGIISYNTEIGKNLKISTNLLSREYNYTVTLKTK